MDDKQVSKRKYNFNKIDYFNMIFREQLGRDEYYNVTYINKENDTIFIRDYKTIDDMSNNIDTLKNYNNVFVSLATTNGKSRTRENLVRRGVLAFDFDKKDYDEGFNHKDILNRFSKIGLYYHMMINSGRGYHVYLLTEPTSNIDRLVQINKAIAQKVGADMGAVASTQILRVPDTYNFKDNKSRRCNVIWLQADHKKRIEHNLDKLFNKFCYRVDNTNIRYISKNNMQPCIENLLEGVEEGHRNFALGRLTKYLQRANYGIDKALEVIKEWNNRCVPPSSINKLEVDFNNYWNSDYKLLGCKSENVEMQSILSGYCNKTECKKSDKYEVIHLEKAINIEYKIADKIKDDRRGKGMNGNHIAIISILKLFESGLSRKQIEEELTHRKTKRQAISKNTLTKILKELVDDYKVIDTWKVGRDNFYKIKDIKALENQKFVFGYGAIRGFLGGEISSAELRIYCYMRYRLSKGDNVVQEEIARDLNITQQAISKHMKSLEDARYLITHTDYSINPLGANIYEWIVQ